MRTPAITGGARHAARRCEGMVSLRGALVPGGRSRQVFRHVRPTRPREIMIVTEYNGHTQGFLVEGWTPSFALIWTQDAGALRRCSRPRPGGLVTAVTELAASSGDDARRREGALRDDQLRRRIPVSRRDHRRSPGSAPCFIADDSSGRRKQIERTLDGHGRQGLAVGQWSPGLGGDGQAWPPMPSRSASRLT